MATIDAEYYRYGRHICGWSYLGVEEIPAEKAGVNQYLSPTTVEITISEGDEPEEMYANIFVTTKGRYRTEAWMKEGDTITRISLLDPVLLLPGQILEVGMGNRSMDLRFQSTQSDVSVPGELESIYRPTNQSFTSGFETSS